MERNTGHNTKSRQEKDYYSRYIKEQNYEPTVDDSLPFNTSNDKGEDFSLQQANKKRKEPPKDIVLRHFEENWVKWIFGLAGVALFYFFVTFQVNLTRTEGVANENSKDVTDVKSSIEKTNDSFDKEIEKIEEKVETLKEKNQHQDLQIQKNSIMIENKTNPLKKTKTK